MEGEGAVRRSVRIDMRWTPREVAEMDRYRGKLTRTRWLEMAHRLAVADARDQERERELLRILEPDG